MNERKIVEPYHKDSAVESVQEDLNAALVDLEDRLTEAFDRPRRPVILIAGLPRSGTTLLLQLLIASYRIGYVTNLAARFWRAPYVGMTLARDLRRRGASDSLDFRSELGATRGYDGPHEFGFFWNRWFPPGETHDAVRDEADAEEFSALRREIAAMEQVADAPMVFKNPIVFNMQIKDLADALPTAIFLICRREPIFVAQSIVESREKRFGNRDSWLGVKPTEYTWLKDLPYEQQVAGQIVYTLRRIAGGVAGIPSHRSLEVDYGDLCRAPRDQLRAIESALAELGAELQPTGYEPKPFEPADTLRLDGAEVEALQAALARFAEEAGG